jgi:hypothetical protein
MKSELVATEASAWGLLCGYEALHHGRRAAHGWDIPVEAPTIRYCAVRHLMTYGTPPDMIDNQIHHASHAPMSDAPAPATLMLLPTVSDHPGTQALQQNLAGLINGVLQTNLYAAQEIFRATTPEAVLELQQRFVRDYMAALIHGTMTLVRTIQETAEQALPDGG